MCDAPAKAFVRGTKQFSAYHGCDHFEQWGLWVGRMTYPETQGLVLRTNESFHLQSNEDYHSVVSRICLLPRDMVTFFSIDYMHQVCLGLVKHHILSSMQEVGTVQISSTQAQEISHRLNRLMPQIPNLCACRPQGWLSRSLTSREHASRYMRRPCKGHEQWFTLLPAIGHSPITF